VQRDNPAEVRPKRGLKKRRATASSGTPGRASTASTLAGAIVAVVAPGAAAAGYFCTVPVAGGTSGVAGEA
jgi:hypothetical protein